MRRVTRDLLVGLTVVLVLLLALGAVPSLLKSGDPFYVVATPVDDQSSNVTAVNSTALDAQFYPFTATALSNATADEAGRSGPYWRGPVGLKGAFTHSPFDEHDALSQQYPAATDGEQVRVRHNGTLYHVAVTQPV
ncbi:MULTISPECIES: hypothetical protein [Haloarcula]|uniref:hypothetical protein n=1 Tax=Haloarcula TaxID=2237 RepID=UPI0023EB853D|nr:hypothetical protein [Halomicroarcula sp. XH51]